MAVDDALLTACPQRMRPVLMTSLTVILALFPAALGIGAGAEQYGALAVAVIGGMAARLTAKVMTELLIAALIKLLWKIHREHKP